MAAILEPGCTGEPPRIAAGGTGISYWHTNIDAALAAKIDLAPKYILCDIDVNVMGAMPTKATWVADYQYVINAFHAKWPAALIYIAKPWMRGKGSDPDTEAEWVDELVAANPGLVFVGHDERIWLEGGDDGATMTSDGVHYSAAGDIEIVNQWKTVLGY